MTLNQYSCLLVLKEKLLPSRNNIDPETFQSLRQPGTTGLGIYNRLTGMLASLSDYLTS